LLLLGVALYTVQSILPAPLTLALWGGLLISAGVLVVSQTHGHQHGGWSHSLWRRCAAAVLAVLSQQARRAPEASIARRLRVFMADDPGSNSGRSGRRMRYSEAP